MSEETAVLGGGCFWCLEAAYQEVRGVTKVVSGYAGGDEPNPTYEKVCTGTTGYAEVVKITFDPTVINFEQILEIFWAIHDPTTPNRQGNDVGSQYRSVIFFQNEDQKLTAEASIQQVQKLWANPVVTQLQPIGEFYPAEDYHQNYFRSNPEQGYCQVVINPKLQKLRQKFAKQLKN